MSDAEMWRIYTFRGFDVMVIQRWSDPYGRRMVRIETIGDGEPRAEGMRESLFLADAIPHATP